MKSKIKKFAIVALALLASACATKYGKEGVFSNGYSDFRIADDTFVVNFRANEYTKSEKVIKYALMRAAELTLQNGYHYFTVLEEADTTKSDLQFDLRRDWTSGSLSQLHYPSLRLKIKCFNQKPSEPNAIEAANYLRYNNQK